MSATLRALGGPGHEAAGITAIHLPELAAEFKGKAKPTQGNEFGAYYRDDLKGDLDFRVKPLVRKSGKGGLMGIMAANDFQNLSKGGIFATGESVRPMLGISMATFELGPDSWVE